ncbi:hypothetical protein, partial [Mycobacterium sp. 1245801.1]|uniref:hypothetical protein n=1 Tax=Mycobacterium sp. 1245801.1 TaxID=1834075 RepID=UPI003512E874
MPKNAGRCAATGRSSHSRCTANGGALRSREIWVRQASVPRSGDAATIRCKPATSVANTTASTSQWSS